MTRTMHETLTREIQFTAAYDKRAEGKGQHCAEMRWYVKGSAGAVQFVVMTGWGLSTVSPPGTHWKEMRVRGTDPALASIFPLPSNLGYHSPVARYEGQTQLTDHCPVIGGPCFYDGSSLNAEGVFALLIHEGSEAVWKRLEEYYAEIFLGSPDDIPN